MELLSYLDFDFAPYRIVFCSGAISVPLVMIWSHGSYWTRPHEQKIILVSILIPPILATASYLAMLVPPDDTNTLNFLLLDSIKECSVGLGLAMFLGLLQAYLNINTNTLSTQDVRCVIGTRVIRNVFPVTLFQPECVVLELENLKFYKYWTWQFLVIRLVCSVLMIVLQLLDIYPTWLFWAFFFILNVSAFLACYSAFAFFQAFVEDFALKMPADKFRCVKGISICVKGIVFICFCQGGVLRVLTALGLIKSNHFWRQELQNNLLSLEMYIFAIIQGLAYSHIPYAYIHQTMHPKAD